MRLGNLWISSPLTVDCKAALSRAEAVWLDLLATARSSTGLMNQTKQVGSAMCMVF